MPHAVWKCKEKFARLSVFLSWSIHIKCPYLPSNHNSFPSGVLIALFSFTNILSSPRIFVLHFVSHFSHRQTAVRDTETQKAPAHAVHTQELRIFGIREYRG